jgi:hypothetical protein
MIRILVFASLLTLASTACADVIVLDFNAPVPGTLADTNGLGTGFTHRLPGSGGAIPANDPNLLLDTANGRLIVNSTRSDFNTTGFGRNLAGMEAPTIGLPGIGAGNLSIEAIFFDLQVDQLSDQIGVLAGSSVDNVVRGGTHEAFTRPAYQAISTYSLNGGDIGPFFGILDLFAPGDDMLVRLSRINGQWQFFWQNLTQPNLTYASPFFTLPLLDAETDLYVGIYNHDARNTTPQQAFLGQFTVRTGTDATVPEPATLWLALVCALLAIAKRRTWTHGRVA